ncbi:MAG: metalloregulator ArsR/SmtB family transcription factor [Pseudomonadota bacterium]|nr:metalloregulator ArsR/SmtB family transcription factor [Pseudomonadota bacterium]
MESSIAIEGLAALAQETRLQAFKILVRHEPEGMAAGELARLLKVPQNTLSTHLAILSRASLVTSERQSRSIVYRANLEAVRGLVLHLLNDCCNGRPELCAPLIDEILAPHSTKECC